MPIGKSHDHHKRRNRVLLWILLAFVGMVYYVTVLKIRMLGGA